MIGVPERSEAAEYYFGYIDQVPKRDILALLAEQATDAVSALQGIAADRSLHRYAPEKWSIRQVVSHLSDTERLFTFRAMWFARGFDSPLPSFDEGAAAATAGADQRTWESLVEEFRVVRAATLAFFQSLSDDAWLRRGTASGHPFSVRALAYIVVGHTTHHLKILRDRYR